MNRRHYRRQNSRFFMFIAVVIIIALAAFSFYEFMNVNSLSQQNAAQRSQSTDLSSKLESLQSQYNSLQSDYKALQEKAAPSPSVSPTPASSGTVPAGKVAYLTFDDGPSATTPKLLDVLKQNNVKATFFIAFMGVDSQQKRDYLKQEADAGNVLGVHSWTHDYDTIYANEKAFLDDFNKMKDVITAATGITPNLCRFPGGIGNTVSITAAGGNVIMPTLMQDVKNMGFTAFDWNAGGEDAETPYPTADKLAQDVLNDAKGHDNVVILLHDAHQFTIDAVPTIVKSLRDQGYTFALLTPQSIPVQQAPAKGKNTSSSSSASPKASPSDS